VFVYSVSSMGLPIQGQISKLRDGTLLRVDVQWHTDGYTFLELPSQPIGTLPGSAGYVLLHSVSAIKTVIPACGGIKSGTQPNYEANRLTGGLPQTGWVPD
jgi:hypothetical protein